MLLPEQSKPLAETLQAIREADIITIGPGSLYTSIIPNLLVDGIVEEIRQSAAVKVYVCNVMTQPGETEGFDGEAHLRTLFAYSPRLRLDYVLVNSTPISPEARDKYLADSSVQVEFKAGNGDSLVALSMGAGLDDNSGQPPVFRVVRGDLLCEKEVVRHDPHKLADLIMDIYTAQG